jgi:hypothetical protein
MKNIALILFSYFMLVACGEQEKTSEKEEEKPATSVVEEDPMDDEEDIELIAEHFVYSGTIGEYGITMKLTFKGFDVSGSYYYHTIGEEIAIEGRFDQGGIDLKETGDANPEVFNAFSAMANDVFEGTWKKNESAEELPFRIEILSEDDVAQLEELENICSYFSNYFDNREGENANILIPEEVNFLIEDDVAYWCESEGEWLPGNFVKPIGLSRQKECVLFVLNAEITNTNLTDSLLKRGTLLCTVAHSGKVISHFEYDGVFYDGNESNSLEALERNISSTALTSTLQFIRTVQEYKTGQPSETYQFEYMVDWDGEIEPVGD